MEIKFREQLVNIKCEKTFIFYFKSNIKYFFLKIQVVNLRQIIKAYDLHRKKLHRQ